MTGCRRLAEDAEAEAETDAGEEKGKVEASMAGLESRGK